jgi:hypothetical protein
MLKRRLGHVLRGLLWVALALSPWRADAAVLDLFDFLRLGHPQPPRTLANTPPRRLLLNGFPLQMLSGRTPESPRQVLDFYELRYRKRSQGALGAPVHRRDGDDFGLLVAADGNGEELLAQMRARKLHYVHLSPLCMVYAQKVGELTDYVAVFSDAPLPPNVLSPQNGQDAPGSDVPSVPRPAGALRSFSLSEPAVGYTAVSYIVEAPPHSAFSETVAQLRSVGWTGDSAFAQAANRSGNLMLRLERPGIDLIVSAQQPGPLRHPLALEPPPPCSRTK